MEDKRRGRLKDFGCPCFCIVVVSGVFGGVWRSFLWLVACFVSGWQVWQILCQVDGVS